MKCYLICVAEDAGTLTNCLITLIPSEIPYLKKIRALDYDPSQERKIAELKLI
jgi:hypothetical protein